MRLAVAKLAEKQTEPRNRKAYTHETEAGANPGQVRSLLREINSRIVRSISHAAIVSAILLKARLEQGKTKEGSDA
jgi:hypothetical protein